MTRLLFKVEVIPHNQQRYPTAGDWQIDKDGAILIKVSDTGNLMDSTLIAIHEIVEVALCKIHGISEVDVDKFDTAFALSHDLSDEEPGLDPKAPYFKQHAAADVVERLVALQADVPWHEYSKRVDALFKGFSREEERNS